MTATTTQPANVFDRLSQDGTLLNRGYLELSLDEQHCEGASPPDANGDPYLTLTLFLCDPSDNAYREARVFGTRICAQTPVEARKRLLVRFMDRLVGKYGVSAFATEPGEVQDASLDGFATEVEYATASWVA